MSITSRLVAVTVILLMLCAVGATLAALHYRSNAIQYQSQRDTAQNSLAEATATITDMQARQRDVAALDAKYTRELANAKATIDQLQSDVAAGRKRLQLNATCKKQPATGAGSLGDDAAPRLTADAERDYWRLRSGIATVASQVNYLQQYIREQCLQ